MVIGCQATQNPKENSEYFDARPGKDVKQVSSRRLKNGWMYTATNGGIPANDPHVTTKLVIVEMPGKSEPNRLSSVYPSYCYELHYEKSIKENYLTWLDILVCPKYKDTADGMLIVSKSIQGSTIFFGATLFRKIPVLRDKISHYEDISLTEADKIKINRFIQETKIYSK